ncbi:MAG: hypothetical protein QXN46_00395 [Candidatus Woesearchaeota archaeon]
MFPQEVEHWYVLPAIRREFALALMNNGLSQKKAASLIGVTEAAISNYKKEKRATTLELEKEIKSKINAAARRILNNKSSLFEEMMKIDYILKKKGIFCRIHMANWEKIKGCESVCKKTFFRR